MSLQFNWPDFDARIRLARKVISEVNESMHVPTSDWKAPLVNRARMTHLLLANNPPTIKIVQITGSNHRGSGLRIIVQLEYDSLDQNNHAYVDSFSVSGEYKSIASAELMLLKAHTLVMVRIEGKVDSKESPLQFFFTFLTNPFDTLKLSLCTAILPGFILEYLANRTMLFIQRFIRAQLPYYLAQYLQGTGSKMLESSGLKDWVSLLMVPRRDHKSY